MVLLKALPWIRWSLWWLGLARQHEWMRTVWCGIKLLLRCCMGQSCELERLCCDKTASERNPKMIKAIHESMRVSKQLRVQYAALRQLSVADGTDEAFKSVDEVAQTVYNDTCAIKHIDPHSTHLTALLLPSIGCIGHLQCVLGLLVRLQRTQYDRSSQAQEKMLLELWDALRPHEALTLRLSKQWETIGFQGDDPATDFRGMGELGLRALLHFAAKYPGHASSMLVVSQHPTRWFPMAITGIQIAQMVLHASLSGDLDMVWFGEPAINDGVYYSLFSVAMVRFARTWQASDATILQFPSVFEQYRADFLDECRRSSAVPEF